MEKETFIEEWPRISFEEIDKDLPFIFRLLRLPEVVLSSFADLFRAL